MAQKRNSVSLTDTAISRLQKLVDTGEYCSLDDAASHVIVSTLPSTGQYSPVLTSIQPKTTQPDPIAITTNQTSDILTISPKSEAKTKFSQFLDSDD